MAVAKPTPPKVPYQPGEITHLHCFRPHIWLLFGFPPIYGYYLQGKLAGHKPHPFYRTGQLDHTYQIRTIMLKCPYNITASYCTNIICHIGNIMQILISPFYFKISRKN
jgi:hypothetical protein